MSVHAALDMLAPTERLGGKLTIDRIDAPGKIAATFDYTGTSGNLVLDLTASEPAGGMISHALSIEGLPPVTAAIKGDGPLSDFKARLNVEAGRLSAPSGPPRCAPSTAVIVWRSISKRSWRTFYLRS